MRHVGRGAAELELLASVTADFVTACRGVGTSQLAAATPCVEWNVAQLIDHVTGGNRFTVRVLDGDDAETALASAFASFRDNDDPPRSGIESSESQQSAFEEDGALDRRCAHIAGDLSGVQVLRLRLHDLIIHTWDLNQVVDPHVAVNEAHVRWAITELTSPDSLTAKHFATAPPEPLVSEPNLLRAFGRRP